MLGLNAVGLDVLGINVLGLNMVGLDVLYGFHQMQYRLWTGLDRIGLMAG